LDGVDAFVEVAHHPRQNLHQALTIEAWVRLQGPCDPLNCIIVMKQKAIGPCCDDFRYGLLVIDDPSYGDLNRRAVLSFNAAAEGWQDVVFSTAVLQDGIWYHLAGTYEGNQAKIYVNGVLEEVVSQVGPILPSSAGPLFIGRDQVTAGFNEFFKGLIDKVEVYNRPSQPRKSKPFSRQGAPASARIRRSRRCTSILEAA
jgi:Concanavalin A-like lectin/glucanases superfamily